MDAVLAERFDRPVWRRVLRVAGPPLAMSLFMAMLCWSAAGNTLGLWFGGIAVATILTPGLVLAEENGWDRLLAGAAVVDGVGVIWLIATFYSTVSFGEWLGAYLLLLAYATALAGVAVALRRLGLPAAAAAAVVVVAGCAWLTWPFWMAPWLSGEHRQQLVAGLVWGHPLFGLNGWLYESFPVPWAQHRFAYAWTNIGDDISYTIPGSIWPSVVVHGLLGVGLLLISGKRRAAKPGEDTAGSAVLP